SSDLYIICKKSIVYTKYSRNRDVFGFVYELKSAGNTSLNLKFFIMFFHQSNLQYKVKVDKPNPQFARLLQQAIGGIEGEMRVCLQYLFQAWNNRGPMKYRDMLMETGTEEISHIEMLCTAVALNLEGAS